MKKHAFVALVAFVLLALTTPVSAQSDFDIAYQGTQNSVIGPLMQMNRNLCVLNQGTGGGMEASYCHGLVLNPMTGRVEGFNPNSVAGQYARVYGYNNSGHDGRQPSVGRQIINSLLRPNPYPNQYPYGYGGYGAYGVTIVRNDNETPGKCIERATKALKKTKAVFDRALTTLIMAGCTGSNVPPPPQSPEQEMKQESQPTLTSWQNQSVPQSNFPRGIFKDTSRGLLCNNTDRAVAILIDGTIVGQLGAGLQAPLASIPSGKLEFQRIN